MTAEEFRAENLAKNQALQAERFRRLNPLCRKGQIVFAGSSLMEHFPIEELVEDIGLDVCVYNRGNSGYVTRQMLDDLREMVLDLEPSKLFINIGTNDIGQGLFDELWVNYEEILNRVQRELPDCQIYTMAYYPCNDQADFGRSPEEQARCFKYRNPASIREANQKLEELARRHGCQYIDVNEGLADENGRMKESFCVDGIHMYPDGYAIVLNNLLPYLK